MSSKREPVKASVPAYTADSIQHMDDLEHVRRLPDMYIGDTGPHGLHHLIHEIVNNSADEVLAGCATEIHVTLHVDNSISVRDNGRGIPVDINAKAGISGVELAMTKLKAGGKFDHGGYAVSGGIHGVGLSCVNFLSEWCEATVHRDGQTHHLRCERGVPTAPLQILPSSKPSPGAMPAALCRHADAPPPTSPPLPSPKRGTSGLSYSPIIRGRGARGAGNEGSGLALPLRPHQTPLPPDHYHD